MNSTFTKILRILLGLILLFFGLNKFIDFMPMFEMPNAAANFLESLKSSGYVFYVVAILELTVGLLLLINKWVPFALILFAPISINILLFHLFLDVSDVIVAIVITVFNAILIYKYWRAYRPLFQY
ncbi:DoxX family membrane protein [Altibacter sp.]|uniref:DoxX family membrane protein n=1 Tax=Altibacter sp. TaxID=2024823 RepID=UPI000C94D10C|nr:DoxX family membrane protein [Altibacter sp.]MAP55718.1 DoxX protein [Altibacter sp.]|tara:strand:- start:713 stop:1090 length:378 start_codon:yes stop_codon:yes gene_type:complete